jgi:hypothetical protein
MLCLECGAEMSLVQVVKDTTMFVPGYEHHTWQCSACSTVEQRLMFTREKTSTQIVQVEPIQSVSSEPGVTAEPCEGMPMEPIEAMPVKLTEAVPVEPTQTKPLEPVRTLPVELSKTVLAEPTQPEPAHLNPPVTMLQTNAQLEKLRSLQERATAAKKAASETERRAEFDRFWESLRPVPSA